MTFSVIVPMYNKAEYVERTLTSLFAQTCSDYEVIVVDDGSTDASYQVVSTMVANHPECSVVRQANAGVSVARNKGAELAKGEYICFLDADDWWEPTFLEEMGRLIVAYPEAGMYGTAFYIVRNGKKRIAPIGVEKEFEAGYINYCKTYARTLCMPITSSSVAIPREVLAQSGGFKSNISLGEDFDLWIRIALKHKVALINKPLANYYQDLPPNQRATRHLHAPDSHMLWNLDYLTEEEACNPDLKLLIDCLRASGLYRFYLSRQYHDVALVQLSKIDWSHIQQSIYKLYHSPLWWQRIQFAFRTNAANLKSVILKTRNRAK